jgi:hypothetical protein
VGPARTLPTSVLVAITVVLVALGGTWWARTQPPVAASGGEPVDDARAPAGTVLVLRLDNGKILKYQSGATAPTSWHRRCRGGLGPAVPGLRSVGQDNMTRCQ